MSIKKSKSGVGFINNMRRHRLPCCLILKLPKILRNKYDSSHEITFSEKPMHPTGCVDVRLVHLKSTMEKRAALFFTRECVELSSLRFWQLGLITLLEFTDSTFIYVWKVCFELSNRCSWVIFAHVFSCISQGKTFFTSIVSIARILTTPDASSVEF